VSKNSLFSSYWLCIKTLCAYLTMSILHFLVNLSLISQLHPHFRVFLFLYTSTTLSVPQLFNVLMPQCRAEKSQICVICRLTIMPIQNTTPLFFMKESLHMQMSLVWCCLSAFIRCCSFVLFKNKFVYLEHMRSIIMAISVFWHNL
jgi:hypothetical protein